MSTGAAGRRTAAHRATQALPAFVLHQWPWSETSLILDLFTRGRGRLAVVAKGAKRPYSQLRPVLMPFQRLLVGLGQGRADESGEILTLRSAEYAASGAVLPPARLMSGFYLNELLLKLLARGDPHEALFDAYADSLQALATEADEAPLRAFELALLRQIGLLPELDRDTARQTPLRSGQPVRLHPEAGLLAAEPGRGLADSAPSIDASLAIALEQALAGGSADKGLAPLRQACRRDLAGLRLQLRPLLHYHLGSPTLRTRQLMLDLRRLLDGASSPPITSASVPAPVARLP